jgi:hypothetical protein
MCNILIAQPQPVAAPSQIARNPRAFKELSVWKRSHKELLCEGIIGGFVTPQNCPTKGEVAEGPFLLTK